MNLIADIGNSFTKIAFFSNDELLKIIVLHSGKPEREEEFLRFFKKHKSDIHHAVVSSVKRNLPDFLQKVLTKIPHVIHLDEHTALPIKNAYKTQPTLGKDRIAAAVGANNIFPHCNVLTVDAGTALTIDFISEEDEFLGGIISPGINMRFNALHQMTERLPQVKPDNNFSELKGQTTENAIKAGVQNGMYFEILGYINHYTSKYPNLKTVLTGGDIFFFENKLKKKIFAEPNLVLNGLNRILHFNYVQKN
jgi:type III pantothenate kinase